MSATDIEKGSRGLAEVSLNLSGMKVGIVCLTPENLNAPWILYEAGALSKAIDEKARLCTYLLGGLQFQDVKPPLGMFQATQADKKETQELLRTINRAVSDVPVREDSLDLLFERMWPDLERKLIRMPEAGQVAVTKRSYEEIVTEILDIVRAEADGRKAVQAQMTRMERDLIRVRVENSLASNSRFVQLSDLGVMSSIGSVIGPPPKPKVHVVSGTPINPLSPPPKPEGT